MKDKKTPTVVVIPGPERVRTEYVTREVHEHRAPTDASVKLLREMEAAAVAAIESHYHLRDNGFECVVQVMSDAMNNQMVAVAVYRLNGKRLRSEARMERDRPGDHLRLAQALRDEMAKDIATAIVSPAIAAVFQKTV